MQQRIDILISSFLIYPHLTGRNMRYSILKSTRRRRHRSRTNRILSDRLIHLLCELLLSGNLNIIGKSENRPLFSDKTIQFAQKKKIENQDGMTSSSRSNPVEESCKRYVFNPTEEGNYTSMTIQELIHYYISTKLFYQNIEKCTNKDLPRKTVRDAWNSLETVVFVKNSKLETKFEEIKAKFKQEGKVDAYGNVSELLLFHGTSNESINKIVENNFCLDQKPDGPRNKVTLFGHGIYFSELPGVSLMYGTGLLLCKVILGKSQRYIPNGSTPPEIPDEFDSRVVIKDGIEVVTVVKDPAQILPYCIMNIRQDRIENAGFRSIQQQQQNNQVKNLTAGQ